MLARSIGLTRLNFLIAKSATVLSGSLVASITAVVAAGVFWRYVLNDSLSWTEEVARYLMIWLAAIGSIVAMSRRQLIAIDILPDALSGMPGKLLRIFISLAGLLTSAVIAYYGWHLATNAWGQTASTFYMPLFFVTLALPVAAAAFCLIALENILSELSSPSGNSGSEQ